MKLLSHALLLVVMLASQKCQESEDWTDEMLPDSLYDWFSGDVVMIGDITEEHEISDVPDPNITVYRQMEDRENVIVLCKFAQMFERRYRFQSFKLSVESELNYTMELLKCSSLDSSEICVFLVTASPPASFTCVHEFDFGLDVRNLRSQTYNYSGSVFDHHEEGLSLSYICFSSFIAVGLFIMTAAVIVTHIRSKTKDSINPTAVTNNDYVET
ncbi:uncharacterized protein LOC107727413 [Sinocyclocheilus rhinocerous]|uniref:uncharacterized protein LOC107727413 n=1 Tax=Sinocyclocheilus rhinocerous TaxID=307959 RepID=UPI0007B7E53A|nr:PREDICTED: uncharacterized protein LOC107727413 [Sinocyclocheilus rhinocerous]